ncbi:hypothetical protein [Synechocystis sp. LKSZ1]|uniref:hypothetical protein n=1 Tax=Synechocystis sp. LKSZ1 TaxID=3144951 RepID=UPI00336BECC3
MESDALRAQPVAQACSQPLPILVNRLLADLPSYANRVAQRDRSEASPLRSYLLLAGRPIFEPLPLNQQQLQPQGPDTTQQVFFTTLERQYNNRQINTQQNFYWAFFVPTQQGWQLALLYAQLAARPPQNRPLPPQSAENSAVGRAIQLWLRDCQAGVLKESIDQGIDKAQQ